MLGPRHDIQLVIIVISEPLSGRVCAGFGLVLGRNMIHVIAK